MRALALGCVALVACGSPEYLDKAPADCSDVSAFDQAQAWTVWSEVPEFGGVILDSQRVHSIRMTEITQTERLWKWYPTDAKFVKVQFNWGELVRVKCQMGGVFYDPDAISLDVDEGSNRVAVTVASAAALERATAWADRHASPRDAVVISIGDRNVAAGPFTAD